MTRLVRGTLLATLVATITILFSSPFPGMINWVTQQLQSSGHNQNNMSGRQRQGATRIVSSTGEAENTTVAPHERGQVNASEKRLYRAFEPASADLDINLHKESLSLFLTFNNTASQIISGKHPALWATELDRIPLWLELPRRAQCQLIRKQFLAEPPAISPHHEGQPSHSSQNIREASLLQVSGYIEYQCQRPELLAFADFMGFRDIPKWNAVSVWLITDHWQAKQLLQREQARIHFSPSPH